MITYFPDSYHSNSLALYKNQSTQGQFKVIWSEDIYNKCEAEKTSWNLF